MHRGIGGLQEHSCGGIYPWTVRVVGDRCQTFNCQTGEVAAEFGFIPEFTFKEAHDAAEEEAKRLLGQ